MKDRELSVLPISICSWEGSLYGGVVKLLGLRKKACLQVPAATSLKGLDALFKNPKEVNTRGVWEEEKSSTALLPTATHTPGQGE
jgi:hypothetical protein